MLNRRRFLEDSILAATAALAGPKRARADQTQAASSASPNERLAIAVIGTGSRGSAHAGCFAAHRDCDVVAVCDADLGRARRAADAVAKRQGRQVPAHQDLRKIIDDPAIDCVSIATCNHWHALAAIWAMQAGKDVYVEKPVSHNISEGRRMVQAARKYNRICQVGTQYRSDGTCKAAARFIAEDKLGKVTLARSITYKRRRSIGPVVDGKVPEGVDYNLWAGPAPMSPITRRRFHYDWHWFWETGNGDLGNSDVHRADLVRFGLGVEKLPRAVMCYGGRTGYTDAAQTPNTQIVVHDYGEVTFVQEVRGLETARFHLHGGAIFTGSEGYVGMAAGSSAFFSPDGKLIEELSGKSDDHFDNFVQAVRSRDRSHLNAEILGGHLSAGLCHLGNISYRRGQQAAPQEILNQLALHRLFDNANDTFERTRKHLADNKIDVDKTRLTLGPWLEFDPDKERFVDNAPADAMLTRCLGRLGDTGSIDLLIDMLENGPTEASLGKNPPPTHIVYQAWRPFHRPAAAWSLGELGAKQAVPVLIATVQDLDNATSTREQAAMALGKVGDQSLVDRLEQMAEECPDLMTRRALLESIDKLSQ